MRITFDDNWYLIHAKSDKEVRYCYKLVKKDRHSGFWGAGYIDIEDFTVRLLNGECEVLIAVSRNDLEYWNKINGKKTSLESFINHILYFQNKGLI